VVYELEIKRLNGRKPIMGIGGRKGSVEWKVNYTAKSLKVGLFKPDEKLGE